jgi:hypothetical protein
MAPQHSALSDIMLTCHYAECPISFIAMVSVIMLCHYAECRYAECHGAIEPTQV